MTPPLCEIKKIAYRQTKDGIAVTFLIHPNDLPEALALAPLGQRYKVLFTMVDDDEMPTILEPPSQRQPIVQRAEAAAERPGVETGSSPTARARASEMGKERYRESTPMEQARVRACRLPDDERFRAWACEQKYGIDGNRATLGEDLAAQFIRDHCCNGGSRKLIATDPEAYRKFLALETMFKIAVGEIAEPR